MWIELTTLDGKRLLVNLDKVETISPEDNGCRCWYAGDEALYVREPYAEVLAKIAVANVGGKQSERQLESARDRIAELETDCDKYRTASESLAQGHAHFRQREKSYLAELADYASTVGNLRREIRDLRAKYAAEKGGGA